MQEKKVLLSIKDLDVKFRVRGRVLTAIRGISLDIYENESIAIVGESGSGKSVFTKTFAGMLDSNGYVDNGKIIFNDEELSDTTVKLNSVANKIIADSLKKLNEYSRLEFGAATYRQMLDLESEKRAKGSLTEEEKAAFDAEMNELKAQKADTYNYKNTLDSRKDKAKIKEAEKKLDAIDAKIKELEKRNEQKAKEKEKAVAHDTEYLNEFNHKMSALKEKHEEEIKKEISAETIARNEILAKEIYLSTGRYGFAKRVQLVSGLLKADRKSVV